jgi:hypothetical protein
MRPFAHAAVFSGLMLVCACGYVPASNYSGGAIDLSIPLSPEGETVGVTFAGWMHGYP